MDNEEKEAEMPEVKQEEMAAEPVKEAAPAEKTAKKGYALKVTLVAIIVLLGLSLFTNTFGFLKHSTGQAVSVEGESTVDFYVMSQCPYGTQVEDAIKPVLDKLGSNVKFTINFIGNDNGDGTFSSLHGQPEVDEDMRQVCAMKVAPGKYMDYVICQNKDIRNAASTWESCANQAGIDAAEIKACFDGAEGKQMLSASFAKSGQAGAQGSPTIFINGKDYTGGRDEISFTREICKAIPTHEACAGMPECAADTDCTAQPEKEGKCNAGKCEYTDPIALEVIVVNDKACSSCSPESVLATTRQLFKGAQIRTVDVADEEGKKLVSELGLRFAPAYLFGEAADTTAVWAKVLNAFEKRGSWYKLRDEASGSSWIIDEKARAETEARYNNALNDIRGELKDNKPTISLFVMSQCPYGVLAENALKPVLDLLGDNIDFRLGFIANDNGDGTFQSLYGQPEVDEDIRQVCAAKVAPKEYIDYIICQNKEIKNAASNWESCAKESGIDTNAMKTCIAGEGEKLLSDSIKVTEALSIGGSPTIFVDGDQIRVDITQPSAPSAFKSIICGAFDKIPEACEGVVTDVAQEATSTPGCGGA